MIWLSNMRKPYALVSKRHVLFCCVDIKNIKPSLISPFCKHWCVLHSHQNSLKLVTVLRGSFHSRIVYLYNFYWVVSGACNQTSVTCAENSWRDPSKDWPFSRTTTSSPATIRNTQWYNFRSLAQNWMKHVNGQRFSGWFCCSSPLRPDDFFYATLLCSLS